jgi:hypothetical protein
MNTTNIYLKTGCRTTMHKEEFHSFNSYSDITRAMISSRIRWEGHVAHMGEMINVYEILIGRPKGTAWETRGSMRR